MKIKASERNAILQSLRNGVVPRSGLQHILVGRKQELEQGVKDIATISQGGSMMRFVIGDYGAGKTFFLNLVKLFALQKNLLVMHADLTNDRRIQGSDGQAVALYSELTKNVSTRTRPDGNALRSVIERFIAEAVAEAEKTERPTRTIIREKLSELTDLVAGFDFADVLNAYYEGYEAQDEDRQQSALKWLRGEFSGKLEARKALGVRNMVDDDSFYDYLKLLARFSVLAGYKGILICLDELASIHSLSNSQARQQNYEQILRIFNDVNQGSAEHLGFLLGGTCDFLEDDRRGIYSHGALATRLAPNQFARNGLVDFSHPVMRLSQLTKENLHLLLQKIRDVHAEGSTQSKPVGDEVLNVFMKVRFNKVGDDAFLTPRETVREFVQFLSVLEENPEASWHDLLDVKPSTKVQMPVSAAPEREAGLAGLANFSL